MSATASVRHLHPGSVPRRARLALLGAGVLGGLAAVCWYLALHSVTVARADAHAYFAFLGVGQHHAGAARLARALTDLCEAHLYVYLAVVPVVIALARRRWTLALVLTGLVGLAPLSCDVLKPLLMAPRPALGVADTPLSVRGSWPSGHSAAATVLAMSLLLASPARWRPLAAVVGTAFSLAMIYSVLILGWHYPSDALGGMLVALVWTLLGVAAVTILDLRRGREPAALPREGRSWPAHMPSLSAMLGVAVIPALVVLLWRGPTAISFAAHHAAFVAAALGLAAAAACAPTALTLVISGSGRAARAARPRRWRPG